MFLYRAVSPFSDCSEHTDTTIGSSYSLESFGYPGGLTSGAICTWTFTGNNNTWFRFDLEDFDIGNSSCRSYLMVGKEKFCGNETINNTLLVYQPFLKIKLAYRDSRQNRGIRFYVLGKKSLQNDHASISLKLVLLSYISFQDLFLRQMYVSKTGELIL